MAQIGSRTTANSINDHLADHVELAARHNEFEGAWSTYTPVLTAATTNPTLGTGSFQGGRYTRIGRTIIGWAYIAFGNSGTAAGSGEYRVSLPVTSNVWQSNNIVIGNGYLYDSGVNTLQTVTAVVNAAGHFIMFKDGAFQITHAAPWAWGASDHMSIQFMYEVTS